MSDGNYIQLLRCPIDHLPLSRASSDLVRQIAESLQRIMNGDHQNAKNWISKMDGGLIRSDGRIMYPIIDGIPKLLVDEAIDLEQLGLTGCSE